MSEKRISVLQFFSLARRRKVGDDAIRCKSTEKQIVDAVHLVVVGDRGNLRVAWPCRFAASRPPRSPANRGGVARRRARANSRAWSRRRRMSGARPSRPRWKNVVKGRVVFHLFTPNRDGSMKNWNFTVNFSIKSNEKWRDHFTVKSRTLDRSPSS